MSKDLTVMLEDHPGALAQIGEAFGRAGMNIEGMCAMTAAGKGIVHILVEDGTKARRILEANHIQVSDEKEVLVLDIEDRPGILGNIARRLGAVEVNIQLAYLATSTRLVIGVDNLEKANMVVMPKKTA
jgi:hypothetical protein